MNDERYVAAIEISSSKIIAAVGTMRPNGQLNIIATEKENCVENVRYGILQNLEETSVRVNRILDNLQSRAGVSPMIITGLYVGLSGRSLRSISTEVQLQLPDDTEITQDILDKLQSRALSTAIDSSLEVIDAIPRRYTVGREETRQPKGQVGNSIRATFDLIVCRPELRRNLQRTLEDKTGVDINGVVVTALATAQVLLTSEEKRLGCMLVDMGSETTTVSIYKDGSLRYLATLPMGGRNITRDITSLNVLEERAEDLKLTAGNALARETASTLQMNEIKIADVNNLIVARSEEIVANVVEQLKYAELKDSDLPAGLICIGGGSKLNGMVELLERQTSLKARRGTLPDYIRLDDPKAELAESLQLASLMYAGAAQSDAQCLEEPQSEKLPVTGEWEAENEDRNNKNEKAAGQQGKSKRNSIFSKLSKGISSLFAGSAEEDNDLYE